MRASQYLPRFTTLPPGARLVVGQGLLNKAGEKLVVYHGISPGGRPYTECIPAAAAAEREAADVPAPAAAPPSCHPARKIEKLTPEGQFDVSRLVNQAFRVHVGLILMLPANMWA